MLAKGKNLGVWAMSLQLTQAMQALEKAVRLELLVLAQSLEEPEAEPPEQAAVSKRFGRSAPSVERVRAAVEAP